MVDEKIPTPESDDVLDEFDEDDFDYEFNDDFEEDSEEEVAELEALHEGDFTSPTGFGSPRGEGDPESSANPFDPARQPGSDEDAE